MAVVAVPEDIGFEDCQMGLVRATAQHRSPLTGKRQVVASAYALWQFEGNIVPAQGVPAGRIRSFLVKLGGRKNTFRLPVPAADFPLSGYSGTQGLIKGAGASGISVPTDGWTPNTLVFRDGDYFNIGDELKMATADLTANGAGNLQLQFEPALRNSPADNAIVRYLDPFIYLSADEDDVAKWALKDFNTHTMRIKALEAYEG